MQKNEVMLLKSVIQYDEGLLLAQKQTSPTAVPVVYKQWDE